MKNQKQDVDVDRGKKPAVETRKWQPRARISFTRLGREQKVTKDKRVLATLRLAREMNQRCKM